MLSQFLTRFLSLFAVVLITTSSAMSMDESPPKRARVAGATEELRTPPHQQPSPFDPTSVRKITQPVPNHCRDIVEALDAMNWNQVKEKFRFLLDCIPYSVRTSPIMYQDQNLPKFYRALFFQIFSCLLSSTSAGLGSAHFDPITKTIYAFLQTKIEDAPAISYVLQFRLFEAKYNGTPKPTLLYQSTTGEILQVISLDLFLEPRIAPDAKIIGHTKSLHVHHYPTPPAAAVVTYPRLQVDNAATTEYVPENQYKFLRAAFENDTQAQYIVDNLQKIFNAIPEELRIDCEKFYHSLFFVSMLMIGNGIHHNEYLTAAGRADVIIETDHVVSAIEFKRNGDTTEAFEQINNKGYLLPFMHARKTLFGWGINIDTRASQIQVTCGVTPVAQRATSPVPEGIW